MSVQTDPTPLIPSPPQGIRAEPPTTQEAVLQSAPWTIGRPIEIRVKISPSDHEIWGKIVSSVVFSDPILDQPEFVAVRERLGFTDL